MPAEASKEAQNVEVPTPYSEAQRKSLCSIHRCLNMCQEMDVYAKHTVERLQSGEKQLQQISNLASQMESNLIQTSDNLQDMVTCCGMTCNLWRKKNIEENRTAFAENRPVSEMAPKPAITEQAGFENDKKQEILLIPHDPLELQLDGDLDLVEGFLDTLEQMTTQITTKLEDKYLVDLVTTQMERNIVRVALARKLARDALENA